MKHGLSLLLAAALCMGLASCAMLDSAPEESVSEESVSSEAASSAATSSTAQRLARKKTPNTAADVFKAIAYEKGKNDDTVGWLMVPGTDIDDPVVQSHDNLYYLRRTERGAEDIYGCYFADYECNFGKDGSLSPNTVVYGHSDLKDDPEGPKFSQLFRFADPEFARSTPVLYFSTINQHAAWEIFAVFYTDLDDVNYTAVDLDGAALADLTAKARERSLYNYDVTLAEEGEQVLTLSTCTVKYGAREDQRFVVMARRLPDGASPPNGAALSVNAEPVQPQF